MPKKLNLSGSDREFFSTVARAAFLNPFSGEKAELERRIAGTGDGVSNDETNRRAVSAVSARLDKLADSQKDDLRRYSADDREILKNAFLFSFYHKYAGAFDELIDKQLKHGEEPVPVPFAGELMEEFTGKGLSPAAACGYMAMFHQLRRAHFFLKRKLIGRSPAMTRFRLLLWNNIFTRDIRWYERYLWNHMELFHTLILGETGTEKESAADAMGHSGFIPFDENKKRFARSFTSAFIPASISQYPEGAIEAELFGRERGDSSGMLTRCVPHGSIFLEEIEEMTPRMQANLLKILQHRSFNPVGLDGKPRFQGRIIAATSRSMEDLHADSHIRDDLLYLLSSNAVYAPSLRERIEERPEELHDVADSILERIIGRPAPELSEVVRKALKQGSAPDYPWPGNIRELEGAVRRILITGEYEENRPKVYPDIQNRLVDGIQHGSLSAQELLGYYCALLYRKLGTYGEVARRTGLDWRTAKKHADRFEGIESPGQ